MSYIKQNETSYENSTSQDVINVLESARLTKTRIHITYGDTITGLSWLETNDVDGYVGRSCGEVKVPILLHNSKSICGGQISSNHILRITTTKGKKVLYQHDLYRIPSLRVDYCYTDGYVAAIYENDKLFSRHKTMKDAELFFKRLVA